MRRGPAVLADFQQLTKSADFAHWRKPAYAYGWREYELLTLRVGQLDLLAKIIDLGETKNGDQRMITMTEHVFEVLVRCASGKKPGEFCVHPRRRTFSEGLQGCVVERLHSHWTR
jgi:hypothetical protein